MSYQDFKNQVLGKAYDVDGYYGAQCWDGYAKYCQYLGVPYAHCTSSGYVKDIWNNRSSNGMLTYFDEITNLQPGDIVVFREVAAWTPYSHVAIFDSDVDGTYGNFLGQNQGGSAGAFNITRLPYSATFATAFRLKGSSGGGQTQPGGQYPITTSGTFQFTYNAINIRNGMSGLSGSLTGSQFNAGDTVNYDKVYESDGYLWISFLASSGARRSAAVRDKNGTMWGHNV